MWEFSIDFNIKKNRYQATDTCTKCHLEGVTHKVSKFLQKRWALKHVCRRLQQSRDFWDNIWSQFQSYGPLRKKEKRSWQHYFPFPFFFFLYWEISRNTNDSTNIQNLKIQFRVAPFELHDLGEIKSNKHFWTLALK